MPKAYQLTLNKIDDWGAIFEYLQSLTSFNYMIACREFAPKTGKEHYHVYIQFKYSMNLSKKKLLSAHIEVCKGSPQANIAYIKKQGDILFIVSWYALGIFFIKLLYDLCFLSNKTQSK